MVSSDGPDDGEEGRTLSTVEVTEIRDPEDAYNDRGNPDVKVTVYGSGLFPEKYCFEFVRPSEDEDWPKYRYGLFGATEEAKLSENMNDAAFKAAKALAEHTGIPVQPLIKPTSDLEERWSPPNE